MKENLEPNNKDTNEISDNANKSNFEEIKEPKSEKVIDTNESNSIPQNNSAPKVDLNKDIAKPVENNPKSQNNSAPKVDLNKDIAKPAEDNPKSQNNSAPKVDLNKDIAKPAEDNPKSQNNSAPKVDLKKEFSTPVENNPKSQNNSAPKVDLNKDIAKPAEDNPKSQNNSAPKVDLNKDIAKPAEDNPKSQNNSAPKPDIKNGKDIPIKNIPKPKKEPPIEKKPFQEFVNAHLIPSLIEEINQRGLEINHINLQNTNRPIAGDKCWVINCEIKDTCNFWLSFENEDISSLKSISLSKPNQKPSIIESFLIDEKRITLKLIISRVLQRLNGQKLIGVN